MIKQLRKCLFSVIVALPMLGNAQTAVTINECQKLAKENYPIIKRYNLIEQTSNFTLSNISKAWLPQISAYAQATYQSDVVSLPDALQSMMSMQGYDIKGIKKDQYKIGVDINQTVWDGGAISNRKKVASLQTEVQKAQVDVTLYNVQTRVDDLFFGILLCDERLKANEQLQAMLSANIDKLESLLKNGVAMECDVNTMKAEKLEAERQKSEIAASRTACVRVLALFCGKSESEMSNLQKPAEQATSLDNNRPELKLYDSKLQLANAQESALKSGLMPKLSVFAQGYYGYPGFNMYEDMFSHDWSLNGLIGVRLSWNIGNLYTNKNDKQKIALQRSEIENEREVFLFNSKLQSTQENEDISRYRKMMSDDDKIIELRADVRKSAESKLSNGIIDVTQLVQEITKENQARITRSSHEIEMLKHMYELKSINNN